MKNPPKTRGTTVVKGSQLDAARREREEKELLIKSMSSKMSQTEGMVTELKNQLAAQGGQLQSTPTQLTPLDETVKSVGAKYTTRSIRKDSSSQDSQSKENVSVLPQATPPSTIQMITGENKTAPKVQTKRKNVYVSSDAMQKEANKKRSQKALVY
ncbi:hypothetical protein Tco_0153471 [Tanacetum coccineum]